MNILNIEHVSKIYGEKVIFDDISCGIQEGEKVGIIGINGTGKTTFLRMIAGPGGAGFRTGDPKKRSTFGISFSEPGISTECNGAFVCI